MFQTGFIPSCYTVHAKSLITFNAVEVKELPVSDWLFFTSKNSVRFFFKLNFNLKNVKVACVGKGTYKELAKHVSQIDFIGNAVDVAQVGKDFQAIVGIGTCVFPVSDISKRTIQKHFTDQSKIRDLVVYRTEERTAFENPNADVLIFTSPSNARAYFSLYPWQPQQKVIVMGPTTGEQVKELGIEKFDSPMITGELGLIDLI